jgi:hypothetical protein
MIEGIYIFLPIFSIYLHIEGSDNKPQKTKNCPAFGELKLQSLAIYGKR